MNIDISQYRASIGSFHIKYNIFRLWRRKYTRNSSYKSQSSHNRGISFKFLLPLFIIYSLCETRGMVVLNKNGKHLPQQNIGNLSSNSRKFSLYDVYTSRSNQNESRKRCFMQLNESMIQTQFQDYIRYIQNNNRGHIRHIFSRLQLIFSYRYSNISNFQCRYKYGNRNRSRGLRLCHWNKSSAKMSNRLSEIKNIISQHRPHMLGISEANISTSQDLSLFNIADYKIHVGPASVTGLIRIAVYVHKDIKVKLRPDLMSPNLSSIWFETSFKRSKKILVNKMYREWQQLGVSDSLSIPEQLSRWQEHISMWESALNSGLEVVSLGDYNINHCNWMDKNISRSNQTYKLQSLIDELFVRILPLGVSQLVTGPTCHFPGQKSTGLDHIYTNTPEKIINVQKFFCGGSDHMLIYAVRSSKCIRSCPTYLRKKCYKNFNSDLFINSVRNMG